MPGHLQQLAGIKPVYCLSDLTRNIKNNSSNAINGNIKIAGKFERQKGFGVFTVGQSWIPDTVGYILRQEEHPKNNVKAALVKFLNAHKLELKPEYIPEDQGVAPEALDGSNDHCSFLGLKILSEIITTKY